MSIDPAAKYTATFETSKGKIVCELFAKDAPKTVNNFVFLAREGFYDGTAISSRHQGLHGSGRRPDRQRPRRPRL
jgi:cyclophilin family peptidyl-prolyl cis-trans isomerase